MLFGFFLFFNFSVVIADVGDEGGLPRKAARVVDKIRRKAKKEARVEAKRLAAMRAQLKRKREGEQAAKKKAREKRIMHSYFASS